MLEEPDKKVKHVRVASLQVQPGDILKITLIPGQEYPENNFLFLYQVMVGALYRAHPNAEPCDGFGVYTLPHTNIFCTAEPRYNERTKSWHVGPCRRWVLHPSDMNVLRRQGYVQLFLDGYSDVPAPYVIVHLRSNYGENHNPSYIFRNASYKTNRRAYSLDVSSAFVSASFDLDSVISQSHKRTGGNQHTSPQLVYYPRTGVTKHRTG